MIDIAMIDSKMPIGRKQENTFAMDIYSSHDWHSHDWQQDADR